METIIVGLYTGYIGVTLGPFLLMACIQKGTASSAKARIGATHWLLQSQDWLDMHFSNEASP